MLIASVHHIVSDRHKLVFVDEIGSFGINLMNSVAVFQFPVGLLHSAMFSGDS